MNNALVLPTNRDLAKKIIAQLANRAEINHVKVDFNKSEIEYHDLLELPENIRLVSVMSQKEEVLYSRNLLFGAIYLMDDHKDLDKALNFILTELRNNPDNIEACCHYADVLRQKNQPDEAISHLTTLLKRHPKTQVALAIMAMTYIQKEEMQQALSYFLRLRTLVDLEALLDMGIDISALQIKCLSLQPLPSEKRALIPKDRTCAVCLEDSTKKDPVAALSSSFRLYHRACLFQWGDYSITDPCTRQEIRAVYDLPTERLCNIL